MKGSVQTIQPARIRPNASVDALPTAPSPGGPGAADGLIRGQALIFWDPKVPGRKLDAIDTDQITPSTDCISESLERLDERWKAGSFRYLMPDFRERVARGQNFIVAGDRFAIGSSREMSPAGLKGVGEEAGHEVVIVCGAAMGDIFRNELPWRVRKLGWQWLQDEPHVSGGVAIVGSIGWYDYSFAQKSLEIPLRFYRAKISPGAANYFDEYRALLDDTTDLTPHGTVENIGPAAHAFQHDVTQEEDWRSVWVKSRDVGDVDIVVNNAGYFPNRSIDELDLPT